MRITEFNAVSPSIKKCILLKGKKLSFTNVTVEDAPFITELRCDSKKNRFLSKTSSLIDDQIKWIENYNNCDNQAYFIIRDSMLKRIGTDRLYDPQGTSFCWGSWILIDGCDKTAAIESALMVYNYAFYLGFSHAHIDVRNNNYSVKKFHERFGAELKFSDEIDSYYHLTKDAIIKSLVKYKEFLPNGINVYDCNF